MKIFSSKQIRFIDAYTIENEPISSVDLMERAALELSYWFRKHFAPKTDFIFFAGPGNNGGDAWALARILFHQGFENIRFYILDATNKLSPDSETNRQRLIKETDLKIESISSEAEFPFISESDWVVDALFGTGLSRPLVGVAKLLVEYINSSKKIGLVSIDIPSGLFGEDNSGNNFSAIAKADYTLSLQFPKLSFFISDNEIYLGKWKVLPIGLLPEAIASTVTPYRYIRRKDIIKYVFRRQKFSHKGTYGHALIIAGSYGMMGAAVLAVRAAISSGAGLVTAHIPRLGYEIMQTSVPEALVSLDESDLILTEVNNLDKYSAIAIGPGLNTKSNTVKGLRNLLIHCKVPLVIDADAINIIAENSEFPELLPADSILTPHPGEFDRLTKKHSNHFERLKSQQEFSRKYNVIIILKGANTSIAFSDGMLYFNSTGNPGMATGGSGDVLTGVICSLLAQGYPPKEAALLGVYIHGLAGDYALNKKGYHALTPTDIINKLGKAFKKIEL